MARRESLNAILQQFVFFVFLIYHHEYPVVFIKHDGQVIIWIYEVGQEVFVADGFEFVHEFEGWVQFFQGVAFFVAYLQTVERMRNLVIRTDDE